MQEFRPSYQGGGGGGGGGTFIFKVNWHFFILMRMTIQNFYSNKTSQMVHVMDIRMTIQNLFQKPTEWSMSWTMRKNSKSSDLSPAYSQVDPHSKSLVPIIVAGGKDGKILQTMIKRSN